MSYGFDRATAWYYDHIFNEPPDEPPESPETEPEEDRELDIDGWTEENF